MPFPNEHSARIRSPSGFDEFRRDNDRFGSGRDAIFGIKRGPPRRSELQAIRFDKDKHSVAEARQWLRENDFTPILFEPATQPGKRVMADEISMRKGIDLDMVRRDFQARAGTLDEKTRSVEGIIASEHPVTVRDPRTGMPVDEVILMDGLRFPDQVPLLDSHQRIGIRNILGSTRGFHLEKDRDKGRVLIARSFFSDSEQGRAAFQLVVEGHVRDFSIGYRVHAFGEIDPMRTARIAGREFTANNRTLRVAVRSEVRENSLLAIGADPVAKVRKQGALS